MARASYCEKCGETHRPGMCKMAGSAPRRSRGKNQGTHRTTDAPGTVLIAAHTSDWGFIGEARPWGSASYLSNWACTVCGRTATNSSHESRDEPLKEFHPSRTVEK